MDSPTRKVTKKEIAILFDLLRYSLPITLAHLHRERMVDQYEMWEMLVRVKDALGIDVMDFDKDGSPILEADALEFLDLGPEFEVDVRD